MISVVIGEGVAVELLEKKVSYTKRLTDYSFLVDWQVSGYCNFRIKREIAIQHAFRAFKSQTSKEEAKDNCKIEF